MAIVMQLGILPAIDQYEAVRLVQLTDTYWLGNWACHLA